MPKQPKHSSPGDTPALPEQEQEQEQEPGFPVVGVGASAGGLEAFSLLLQHLPPDTGMAFVLVQHLHPEYASALTEILARETQMPVVEATDNQQVEPNHLYVIPPNAHLIISRGQLRLLPRPQERRHALPIDRFFRTLAEEQGSRAIGVILSGNAADGVLGLKAIKGMGGITFTQDEESCKYPGMPHSVITAGCADFVLPPPRIAQELVRIARHPYLANVSLQQYPSPSSSASSKDHFSKIFFLLQRYSGNDFTYYKHSTLERRIKRRMLMHHFEQIEDYITYLQTHPEEIEALFHDLLINVTSFFRDPNVFEVLKKQVFPAFAERSSVDPIRIWVPGCATGEEVYSLAMALFESLGEKAASLTIQIFATDIDSQAIDKARLGVYPENIVQDVSTERLAYFFHKVEGGYRIGKPLRDLCVFATQNVLKDPPFSKIDLVSCRNLLIYLGSILQKKIMTLFHYALQPEGFLLLGSAESIGTHTNLFKITDSAARLYSKKAIHTPLQMNFISPPPVELNCPPQGAHPRSPSPPQPPFNLQKEVERVLLKNYTPAGVVFNKELNILLFHGRTGAFIEPAPGAASFNLLKMARTALHAEILTLIKRAVKENATLRKEAIYFKANGNPRVLNLEVTPLGKPENGERQFLLLFEDMTQFLASLKQAPTQESAPNSRYHATVNELEQELTATKEYLQSVIEQQEITNEELRSANEEIQSSNEELQSINEELETAKEELQSTNEELATVNEELGHRNQELKQVNDDLNNMLSSTRLPIVIVGRDLRLRRFTPPAKALLNLIDSDIGRPISDINPNLRLPDLAQRIREVMEKMQPQQIEIQDQDGHWYTARIQPYQTEDNKINGAVIALIDIHPLKEGLDLANQARDFAEAIVAAIPLPVLVLDKDQRVVLANPAYLHTFQVKAEETTDNLVYYLGNSQWANPALRRQLKAIWEKDLPFDDFQVTHEFEKLGKKTFSLSGRRLIGLKGQPMILLQITEIRAQ